MKRKGPAPFGYVKDQDKLIEIPEELEALEEIKGLVKNKITIAIGKIFIWIIVPIVHCQLYSLDLGRIAYDLFCVQSKMNLLLD